MEARANPGSTARVVPTRDRWRQASGVGLLLLLAACGGGGGGGGPTSTPVAPLGWQQGVYKPASGFANLCASPRTGTDPATGKAYLDKLGGVLDENNWLRSWSNDLYLWFGEITDQDPGGYSTTAAYFKVLKTMAKTPSGADKDKFHFTYPSDQWYALSVGGSQAGYGADWEVLASQPPRSVVVGYTEPGSPAEAAGLVRGDAVIAIDGIDMVNSNVQSEIDALNAALFPSATGQSHVYTVQDPGAAGTHDVTLVSANITTHPVQDVKTLATASGTVGYMLFNDHLATSEAALVTAFTTLAGSGLSDLVIDIRYNGGGYLDIASEVAYMVAGPGPTTGQTFELTQFNSKYPNTDPVTGQAITPTPFHTTTQGFSTTSGQALPTLNLPRVFVLTGHGTCSASEAIINSLRGVGVEVIQVGSTTCGKPYGFYPQDNCGTTYFTIEFRGVNALGFGDYTDGFSPQNEPPATNGSFVGVSLPGCSVADDFSHALGDPAEGRLAAALAYRLNGGSCPVPATGIGLSRSLVVGTASGGIELVPPFRPQQQLRLPRPQSLPRAR